MPGDRPAIGASRRLRVWQPDRVCRGGLASARGRGRLRRRSARRHEQCDDVVANGHDGCCTATCTLVDADGDGVCDAIDPCNNIVPATVDAPRIVLTNPIAPSGDATFTARGRIDVPTTPAIDPASKGFRIVMRHSLYGFGIDATVPGGDGWVTNRGAYWNQNGTYYSGLCTALPGFVAAPNVLCTVAGDYRDFVVSTVMPGVDVGCFWNTCLRAGVKQGGCHALPFSDGCGG